MSLPSEQSLDQPPSKKARTRGRSACFACRSRRSKCDLLDSSGCHRCKQLGTECSLTGTSPMRSYNPPHQAETASLNVEAMLARRIVLLENRLQNLDKSEITRVDGGPIAVDSYAAFTDPAPGDVWAPCPTAEPILSPLLPHSASTSGNVPGESSSSPIRRRASKWQPTWARRWTLPERYGLFHRGMYGTEEEALSDPIAEGVLDDREAQSAYHMFKYHFSQLYPHPRFLVVKSPVPTHPFLLSACMYYLSRCPPPNHAFTSVQIDQLENILYDNLNAYHRGCPPSLDAIHAAFILSFLPPCPRSDITSYMTIDPARMLELAACQVRELGGDSVYCSRLLATLEGGVPPSTVDVQIEDCRIFLSVVNRAVWSSYTRSLWAKPGSVVDNSHRQLLAWLQTHGPNTELDQQLAAEHRILDCIVGSSSAWQTLQRNPIPSSQDLVAGNVVVRNSRDRLQAVLAEIPMSPSLRLAVIHHIWWESVRNVWSHSRVPFPMWVQEAYLEYINALSICAECASELLKISLSQQVRLDSHSMTIGNGIVHAYLALRAGRLHFQQLNPEHAFPACLDVQSLLAETDNALQKTMGQLKDHYRRTSARLDLEQSEISQRACAASAQNPRVDTSNFGGIMPGDVVPTPAPFDISLFLDTWRDWPFDEMA